MALFQKSSKIKKMSKKLFNFHKKCQKIIFLSNFMLNKKYGLKNPHFFIRKRFLNR